MKRSTKIKIIKKDLEEEFKKKIFFHGRRTAIDRINSDIDKLKKEIKALKDSCPHRNIQVISEMAYCKDCNKRLGWHCEKSPTKSCEYICQHEDDYDWGLDDWDDDEDCIYCGQPEERK